MENKEKKSSTFVGKIVWILVTILIAYNVKLYMDNRVPVNAEVKGNGNDVYYVRNNT
jgi:hypothetical protein